MGAWGEMNNGLSGRMEPALRAPAFVLKNYLPEKHKVIILHKYFGKISCIYNKNDAAARLCTGSLLFCTVSKHKSWYEIDQIDVVMIPTNCLIQDITFFHEIVLLCLKILPTGIMVSELFDFLWYVFQNVKQLTDAGRHVVLLRLFLLFDLIPEHKQIYQSALQDPYNCIQDNTKQLAEFVTICWKIFYQEQEG